MKVAAVLIGSKAQGMGHVYRISRILRFFSRYWYVKQVEVVLLGRSCEVENQLSQMLEADIHCVFTDRIGLSKADVIVTDCLTCSAELAKTVRRQADFWISIDDVGPHCVEADFRVNPLYETCIESGRAFNGAKYNFFDRELMLQRDEHRVRCESRLLIMQGGADAHGLLYPIVAGLGQVLSPDINLKVVAGHLCRTVNDIRSISKKNTSVLTSVNSPDELYGDVDAVITAGGLSLVEAAFLGLPTLAISAEPKEQETIMALVEEGLVADYLRGDNFNLDDLGSGIKKLYGTKYTESIKEKSLKYFACSIWDILNEQLQRVYEIR